MFYDDLVTFLKFPKIRPTFTTCFASSIASRNSPIVLFALMCLTGLAANVRSQEFELVHYGDLVDVDVVGSSEFDWRGRLTPEGFLDGLNSFGDPIRGLCRTEEAISADVKNAYAKYLRDPIVVVKVIDRAGRPLVLLDGAVKMSQKFQLNRPAKLLELLIIAGGIRDDASGEIQVFRPANLDCTVSGTKSTSAESNSLTVLNITIKDMISGSSAANPVIRSGDLITVRRADEVYVIGGVTNPRQVSSRTSLTLSRAIASAGGLAKNADGRTATIYRREQNESKRLEIDLVKVAAGEVEDPPLKAFDIIEVPIKGAAKRSIPPMISNQYPANTSIPIRIVD
ncbi:MAG: SLBB domain-containing protein [Pyrinomonadaceae bacterium]